MVNSSLYTWSETILFAGSKSCSRMTMAMMPAMMKKPNDVIRYMYPMTLWSVDDSQPARTEPLRLGTPARDQRGSGRHRLGAGGRLLFDRAH